jgi:hypothetical protein
MPLAHVRHGRRWVQDQEVATLYFKLRRDPELSARSIQEEGLTVDVSPQVEFELRLLNSIRECHLLVET